MKARLRVGTLADASARAARDRMETMARELGPSTHMTRSAYVPSAAMRQRIVTLSQRFELPFGSSCELNDREH